MIAPSAREDYIHPMTSSDPSPAASSSAARSDREALVELLGELLISEHDVDFAYLFGSLAKGRPRAASDVDVAVHLQGPGSPAERLDRALELEGKIERRTDRTVQAVVLNDAPLELRFNVLAHGILVQSSNDRIRRRFYVDTGRRYYDMAPARELFRRRQRERIRDGTFGG